MYVYGGMACTCMMHKQLTQFGVNLIRGQHGGGESKHRGEQQNGAEQRRGAGGATAGSRERAQPEVLNGRAECGQPRAAAARGWGRANSQGGSLKK